jgi:hypothetical protein
MCYPVCTRPTSVFYLVDACNMNVCNKDVLLYALRIVILRPSPCLSYTCTTPSHAGFLTLYHMVSISPLRFFQPNQRLGSDLDNQNKLIGGVSESYALNLLLDNLFWSDILKRLFMSFSNKSNIFIFFVDLCC